MRDPQGEEQNAENVLIIRDRELASLYTKNCRNTLSIREFTLEGGDRIQCFLRVFGIFPENATFEMQIFNLCVKTEGIFKDNFLLDYP